MTNHTLPNYITLISNDGFEFIILREAACVAGTIRKMLDPTSKQSPPSSSSFDGEVGGRRGNSGGEV
ncbi:MAG: hypothetical protein Q9166_003980 [cf. Caloplaca sp. 2 TL-2023]